MEPSDDQLRPQHVDAQIEELIQYTQAAGTPENHQSAQLTRRLQQHYESEKQAAILARAWRSIAQKYEDEFPSSAQAEQSYIEQITKKELDHYHMQYQKIQSTSTIRKFSFWGTLLAVAVLALVVGSTMVILSQASQQHGAPASGGGVVPICTTTAMPTMAPPTAIPTTIPPTSMPTTVAPTPEPTTISCPTPTPSLPTQVPVLPTPTQVPALPTPTQAPVLPTPTQVPTQPTPTQVPTQPTPTQVPTLPTPTQVPTLPTPTPGH